MKRCVTGANLSRHMNIGSINICAPIAMTITPVEIELRKS